jgi:hypothetical protein
MKFLGCGNAEFGVRLNEAGLAIRPRVVQPFVL